jgi:hypothetical protein
MKRAIAALLPLALVGCGLPPAVTLISYALDGISLISTGKTVGDHALSVAANQDCAVWRAVDGEEVCKEFKPGKKNVLVAAAEAWARGNEIVGLEEPGEVAIVSVSIARAADPVVVPSYMQGLLIGLDGVVEATAPLTIEPVAFAIKLNGPVGLAADPALNDVRNKSQNAATPPKQDSPPPSVAAPGEADSAAKATAADPARSVADIEPAAGAPRAIAPRAIAPAPVAGARVLVVGSFASPANAAKAARAWPELRPTVVPARIRGKTFFRVVSAPLGDAVLTRQLGRVRSLGVKGAWIAPLCDVGEAASARGCIPPSASLRR